MATTYDLDIDQGTTFRRTFVYEDANGNPIDLTGWMVHGHVRGTRSATARLLYELPLTFGDPVAGEVVLLISPEDSEDFDWSGAAYDIELVAPNGDVTRLLQGTVNVSREVTRLV